MARTEVRGEQIKDSTVSLTADVKDVLPVANGGTGSSTAAGARAALGAAGLVPRVSTVASSATPSIDTDTTDLFTVTALATAITSMTTNLTGTPSEGQRLAVRIKDNGTARAITWGASFVSSGVATLLSSTVANKTHMVDLRYDAVAAKWVCLACDLVGY